MSPQTMVTSIGFGSAAPDVTRCTVVNVHRTPDVRQLINLLEAVLAILYTAGPGLAVSIVTLDFVLDNCI